MEKFIKAENIKADENSVDIMRREGRGPFAELEGVSYECVGGMTQTIEEGLRNFHRPEIFIGGIYPDRRVLIETGEVVEREGFVGIYGLSSELWKGVVGGL